MFEFVEPRMLWFFIFLVVSVVSGAVCIMSAPISKGILTEEESGSYNKKDWIHIIITAIIIINCIVVSKVYFQRCWWNSDVSREYKKALIVQKITKDFSDLEKHIFNERHMDDSFGCNEVPRTLKEYSGFEHCYKLDDLAACNKYIDHIVKDVKDRAKTYGSIKFEEKKVFESKMQAELDEYKKKLDQL